MSSHTVAVTGASGFVGSHVVKVLLEAGHRVHATVRNPADAAKTSHLKAFSGAEERLHLFAADLVEEGSFDEAFADCDWLCHIAAVLRVQARNAKKKIVEPTVKGTNHVLHAAARAGIQRVVMTSSVVAVAPDDREGTYREDSWNDTATAKHDPYPYAKTQSERDAWRIAGGLAPEQRFRLVTLLPAFVVGPILCGAHLHSTVALVDQLITGKLPGAARIRFNLVDVRDVAAAHLVALEHEKASGRYILANGGLWTGEIADILHERFPDAPVPTLRLPDFLVYALALFARGLSMRWLRNHLGTVINFDATRIREELGFEFRPLEETVAESAASILRLHGVME